MIIKNESEFKDGFRKNYRQLAFSKIIRDGVNVTAVYTKELEENKNGG